jgi:hypothetical protein
MNIRFYLVTNGKIYAIWELTQQQLSERLKQKPQFEVLRPYGGYSTRVEADEERQRLRNSK